LLNNYHKLQDSIKAGYLENKHYLKIQDGSRNYQYYIACAYHKMFCYKLNLIINKLHKVKHYCYAKLNLLISYNHLLMALKK